MERHPDSASSPGLRADPDPVQTAVQTAPERTWLHRLVNFGVAVVVLAVAAGMFVFSYPGVHAIARQGGVSGQLARFYPALFDAVLVIACVAAVMLRDARWWARCWAWLVAIVILGAIGTTDVLHAMSYGLRERPTEGVVAAAPVAAVLLAFSLFLTMLRQSRPQPRRRGLPARQPLAKLADAAGRAAHRPDDVLRRRHRPGAGGGRAPSARAPHRAAQPHRPPAHGRPTCLTTTWNRHRRHARAIAVTVTETPAPTGPRTRRVEILRRVPADAERRRRVGPRHPEPTAPRRARARGSGRGRGARRHGRTRRQSR